MGRRVRGAPLELRRVVKRYGDVLAVDDVSLEVQAGEFLTLLGPSGSGKTSTLMLIAGFESVDSGDIAIAGRSVTRVPPYGRNLGFVFQHYALFPHMTVAENLAYPLRARGVARAEIRGKIETVLDLVVLPGMEQRMPSQLSGGQQQRVALARALIFDPPVLLMDEPLSALDKKLRQQMQLELKRIKRELGVTVIYVTHDQEEALTMSDRVAVMNAGRIAQVSSPEEIYERPSNGFVADFIGETNLLTATVESRASDRVIARCEAGGLVAVPATGGLEVGDDLLLTLRPERLCPSPGDGSDGSLLAGSRAAGVVRQVVYVGQSRTYQVDVGGCVLVAMQQSTAGAVFFSEGDRVQLEWNADDVKIVGVNGEPSAPAP